MSVNGNQKGKRGERELAKFFRSQGFETARRGQQFSGGSDSPDVVGLPGWHVECKRTEQNSLYKWRDQAIRDAGNNPRWTVFHRRNDERWMVILDAEVFLSLLPKPQEKLPWE